MIDIGINENIVEQSFVLQILKYSCPVSSWNNTYGCTIAKICDDKLKNILSAIDLFGGFSISNILFDSEIFAEQQSMD